MKEYDYVVLLRPIPEVGLLEGDVGTIVYVHAAPASFEVEFVSGDGGTVALLTMSSDDVRPIAEREILHVRRLDAR